MKTVKFIEAIQAFVEGKKIYAGKSSDNYPQRVYSISDNNTMYAFSKEDIQGEWKIKEEPKVYTLAFFKEGKVSAHENNAVIIYDQESPPYKIIKVREVIEE